MEILQPIAAILFAAGFAYAGDVVRIDVLSNRADLISGGDALVAVAIPAGANASAMRVTVGKRDVTAAFAVRADGRYLGRIEGLALGANVVTAKLPDGRARASPLPTIPAAGRCSAARRLSLGRAIPERATRFVLGRRATSTSMFQRALTRRRRRDSSARLGRRMRTSCLTTRPILRPLR